MTIFLKLHLLHAESSGLVDSNILAAAIVSIRFVLFPSLGVASEIKQFFVKNKNTIFSPTRGVENCLIGLCRSGRRPIVQYLRY